MLNGCVNIVYWKSVPIFAHPVHIKTARRQQAHTMHYTDDSNLATIHTITLLWHTWTQNNF